MSTNNKNDLSTKPWFIKYQVYTTINKNYKRVTEADTHEIPILHAIETEKESKGSFYKES